MSVAALVIRVIQDGFELIAIDAAGTEERLAYATDEQGVLDQIPSGHLRVPTAGADAPEIRGVWISAKDPVLDVEKLVFPSASIKADVRKG